MIADDYIDIVFDGPPGHEAGRFVEVENSQGASINFGQWLQRLDGYWVLRIENTDAERHRRALERIDGGFINSDFVLANPPDWHSAFNQLQGIARVALAAKAAP